MVPRKQKPHSRRQLPWELVAATVTLTLSPAIVRVAGFDFGVNGGNLAEAFESRAYAYHMLEWTAFCIAILATVVAWMHAAAARRNILTPILVVTLGLAGLLGAIRMSAQGWMDILPANHTNALALYWVISQLCFFAALILNLMFGYRSCPTGQVHWGRMTAICVTAAAVVIPLFSWISGGATPVYVDSESIVCRSLDLVVVPLILVAAFLVARLPETAQAGVLGKGLKLALLPALFAQIHLAFGSTLIFDHHFLSAYFLHATSQAVLFAVICVETFGRFGDASAADLHIPGLHSMITRREAELAAIREMSGETTLLLAPDGTVVSASRAAGELFDEDPDALTGSNIATLLSLEDSSTLPSLAQLARRGGQECTAERKNGPGVPVRVKMTSIACDDGNEWCVAISDISPEKKIDEKLNELSIAEDEQQSSITRTREALHRQQAELDEFAYLVSEDLQQPVRKLMAFAELLKVDLGYGLPRKAAKDLEIVCTSAENLQKLVHNLLEVSRINRASLRHEMVSVDDCIDRALWMLADVIDERNPEIIRGTHPRIVGDKDWITQVYRQLIHNAIKFADSEVIPSIELTLEHENGECVFGVRDNGVGIDPEHHEEIFAPFKRLQGSNIDNGTGVGLTICRKFIERVHGRIWIESATGEGTHVKFTFGSCLVEEEPFDEVAICDENEEPATMPAVDSAER